MKYALSYFQYGLHNHIMLFIFFFKRFIINLLFTHSLGKTSIFFL